MSSSLQILSLIFRPLKLLVRFLDRAEATIDYGCFPQNSIRHVYMPLSISSPLLALFDHDSLYPTYHTGGPALEDVMASQATVHALSAERSRASLLLRTLSFVTPLQELLFIDGVMHNSRIYAAG